VEREFKTRASVRPTNSSIRLGSGRLQSVARATALMAALATSMTSTLLPSFARADKYAVSLDRAISVLQRDSSSALQIQILGQGSDTLAVFNICEQTGTGAGSVRCEPIGRTSGYSLTELQVKERRAQARAVQSLAINIGAGLLGTVVAGAGTRTLLQHTNPAFLNGNAAQQLVGALAIVLGAGAGGSAAGGVTYLILRPDAAFEARDLFRFARDGSVGVVVDDLPSVVDAVTSILMSEN
jgi:hypothetical protein